MNAFNWYKLTEVVCEIKRVNFEEALEIPIMQFLLFIEYNIFKNKELEKQYKK